MDKSVIISIKGVQSTDGEQPEVIELVTEGKLLDCGDAGYTLTYQESQLTGLEGTTTVVRVDGPRVTLLREGSINSQMVFEEGQRHLSMYETPYGSLSVGILTRRMRSTLGEAGGDLEIDYAIEIDHLLAGQNIFRMNVKKDPSIAQ